MTSLLDVGPLTEDVAVNGKQIIVHGMTPEDFFYMLEQFPMLQQLFSNGAKNLTMDMMRESAPASIAHTIAVTTTDRDDYETSKEWLVAIKAVAKVAKQLSAHYQVALFQAALRLTFPEGIGPFMQRVETLADSINRVSGKTVAATTSSKRSRSGFVADSRGMRLGRGAPSANSRH